MSRIRILTVLIAFQIHGQVYGQLILTEEANLQWISELRAESELPTQLEIIRTRILADTNVYVKAIGDRLILKTGGNIDKKEGLCRPLLIVEGYFVQMTNDSDKETVENLARDLTTRNVKQLEVN